MLSSLLEEVASDLHKQGDVDLPEYFVYNTNEAIVSYEGAASEVSELGVGTSSKLWPPQMLVVFRSPLVHEILGSTKVELSAALKKQGISPIYVDGDQ